MSGHDIENTAFTGPIKVIVKQDGIGRTGGIVIGIFAGLAFGVATAALVVMVVRDGGLREEMKNTQTEYRVMLNHQMKMEADLEALKEK